MKITAHVFESSEEIDITDSLIISSSGASAFPDCLKIVYPLPENGVDRVGISLLLNENFSINTEHEYNLSFDYGFSHGLPTLLQVALVYYDSSGSLVDEQIIITEEQFYGDKKYSVDVDFKPVLPEEITGGYKCNFEIRFVQTGRNENSFMQRFFVSSEIDLMDKDDDSGWFQKIINAIKEIPDKLGSLGDRISNFFSDLKNGIGSFFTEQWNNLKGAFENIGTWFVELGDKFNVAIEAVGEFIIDGIREILEWAFVPSEEFMDEYIQVIRDKYEEHFGIFAQVTLFLTDTLEYVDGLMDYDYEFTFPEVSLPIAGKTYIIIEKQTVNMEQWLEDGSFGAELYSIYQTCVWAILIYCIFKYALIVEDVIISGSSSLATKEVVGAYF